MHATSNKAIRLLLYKQRGTISRIFGFLSCATVPFDSPSGEVHTVGPKEAKCEVYVARSGGHPQYHTEGMQGGGGGLNQGPTGPSVTNPAKRHQESCPRLTVAPAFGQGAEKQ